MVGLTVWFWCSFRNHEANVLVATDVMEEGIDVPFCNVVIKFDRIDSYKSYVQSKGRARSAESNYLVVARESDAAATEEGLLVFDDIQEYLWTVSTSPGLYTECKRCAFKTFKSGRGSWNNYFYIGHYGAPDSGTILKAVRNTHLSYRAARKYESRPCDKCALRQAVVRLWKNAIWTHETLRRSRRLTLVILMTLPKVPAYSNYPLQPDK